MRLRKSKPLAGAIVLMCLMGVSACSADGGGNSGSADGGSTSGPSPQESNDPSAPDSVARDDLTNEKVIPWARIASVSDTSVRVFFVAGDPACYGARAIVEEATTEIKVAVIQGTLPGAPAVCKTLAVETSLLVELTSPKGERAFTKLEFDGPIPPA